MNEACSDALRDSKIYIAGHRGMVGSALVRLLQDEGCEQLVLRTRSEVDLTNQAQVHDFIRSEKPDHIILAAARVGGITANNTYPAQFIYDNLMIPTNIIHAAHQAGVSKLLFLGSSCIYPRLAPQPMPENCLLSGKLEATNEPYAIAKIAGIKLCESYNREYGTDYRSIMPTNLYGPNDNYDLKNSHVLPALIRKFHEAKMADASAVEVWGTGTVKREFLHVNDLAEASLFLLRLSRDQYNSATEPMCSHINVGSGTDITIRELAKLIQDIVGFNGALKFNPEYPDGTPRKLLDVSRLLAMGWSPRISLKEGIASTYSYYLQTSAQ